MEIPGSITKTGPPRSHHVRMTVVMVALVVAVLTLVIIVATQTPRFNNSHPGDAQPLPVGALISGRVVG